MSPRLTRWYPRAWRDEYGEEFSQLLSEMPLTWRVVADVAWHAGCAHVRYHRRVLEVAVALCLFAYGEIVSVRAGVTENVAWAPTDMRRALLFVVTFAPVATVATSWLVVRLALVGAGLWPWPTRGGDRRGGGVA